MKIFLLYIIVLLSISCRTISKNHLIGTYLQNNDKNTLIIFNSKDFLVKIKHKQLDAPPCAYGDTITYGNWEIENNKMISIDNTNLISSLIESEFQESFKFNDSVAIHINNPIEYFYLKNKENVRRRLKGQGQRRRKTTSQKSGKRLCEIKARSDDLDQKKYEKIIYNSTRYERQG